MHIIPETFIIDEHHVHVYTSKDNNGKIIRAERPADLFHNSIATPALVASILNGKYVHAIPLERQARAYKDNGINLATNTMANWIIKSAERYLFLIYDRIHELIYDGSVIRADETPVKCMRIDKTKIKSGKKTYMRVYKNNPHCSKHPIVLYDWQPSRRADHPREVLLFQENCWHQHKPSVLLLISRITKTVFVRLDHLKTYLIDMDMKCWIKFYTL